MGRKGGGGAGGRTVVRLGWRGADGLEKGEVQWPGKGKAGKIWRCVMLKDGEEAKDGEDFTTALCV